MPIPTFSSPCIAYQTIARDVYEFRLRKPEGFSFKAGQFVLFQVPLVDHPSDVQTRAFSISSAPSEPDLHFVAKMKEGGRASRWISEVLAPGISVQFQGPFGAFVLHPENLKPYCMVATSSGVAPFRSQIVEALTNGDTRPIDLLFGVRSREDLFWVEEFQELARRFENFSFHPSLTAPDDAWTGHRGRVQTLFPLVFPNLISSQLYVCGNPQMTLEVKKHCIEGLGMDRKDVHVEGYI